MAASVALLGSVTWNTTAGDKTVVATPSVGDLIIIISAATGATPAAPTDNNSSGTYTQIGSTRTGFSTSGNMNAWVRNALILAASSTTFTSTQTSSTGGGLGVLAVSGVTRFGSPAIRSSGGQSSGAAAGTPAPVLNITPLTTNPIIAAVCNGATAASMTPRSSPAYTEDFDNGYSTPGAGLEIMHINSGETSATITWGSTSATGFADIAFEINAATILPIVNMAQMVPA